MKRPLKIAAGIVAGIALLLVVLVLYVQAAWDRSDPRSAPSMTAPRDSAAIARGEYIFKDTWQCWGCHAKAPADGNSAPSGGLVFDLRNIGPGFGIYYSRNLTPDSATGIGSWTDGEIVQAIREGIRKDRRMLFPLMPVDWLKGLSDEDALAVVAYLRSLPPVHNEVPPAEPSFVAKALITFGVISPLPPITAAVSAPAKNLSAEYGRYVALHLAGCADCHTPRNLQDGKFYLDSLMAGSSFPFGSAEEGDLMVAYARNLRPNKEGIGGWSEDAFTSAVTFGMRPDSTVLSPHMPYAHYKFLADEDVRAVYRFLTSLETLPRTSPATQYTPEVSNAAGAERGKLLFRARCATCHGHEGKGARPTNVSLAEVAPSLNDRDLRDFIASGQPNLKMPAFGKTLSGDQLDDIVAHIRTWQRQ